MQGPADWNPAPKEIRDTCRRAVKHAAEQGIELPELAIKGVVASNADISTHLVCTTSYFTVGQLRGLITCD